MTERTPNDDRSDTLNPNNDANRATKINHDRQVQENEERASSKATE